uniref:Putative lateral signaling target protein 2 n=1 Tax=Anopheles braziliensis TaxID=58242 RepID=A0A2M3Z094_9DIPT
MWDEVLSCLSSRQEDTASPSDTACSSESPAFLGPSASASAHLLLYDQNSSEEELEVINGGAGAVGNCDIIEVGTVSGVPSRIGTGPGATAATVAGLCGRPIAGIDQHQLPMMSDGADEEEEDNDDDEEDDATEEIIDEDDDDDDHDHEEDDEEEDEEVASAIASATTTATVTPKVATTIIGSAGHRPMDTSVRGHFVSLATDGGASGGLVDVFADDGGESLDDFPDELCLASSSDDAPMAFNGMLNVKTVSSSDKQHHHPQQQQQQQRFSTLLEKRKRSLAQNSDDEVRFLLEQQQQTPHHHHPNHHLHHPHHQHHSMRHKQQQQQQQQQQQHLHQQHKLLQQEQLTEEEPLLSAPVNFRTSPPLEALKPHRGHILQRSTTPLILTESGGGHGGGNGSGGLLLSGSGSGGSLLSSTTSSLSSLLSGCGSSASTGGGSSGFYEPGLVGGGIGASGLRFGLGRRTIGCDSPMIAVSHRNNNSTNQQQQQHGSISSSSSSSCGGNGSGSGSGLSTTTSITNTRTSSSSSSSLSSLSSPPSLVVAESQTRSSAVSAPVSSASSNLVTNMEVSRSVSPPAKMFHCAVSPRRRAPRHQQQRLQRPHRPCLDFDKMQQLKARSVTTWRHSNEHSGELSVFCW